MTYDCETCEDIGEVAVDFGIHSTGMPRIEPCPDCTMDDPDRFWIGLFVALAVCIPFWIVVYSWLV